MVVINIKMMQEVIVNGFKVFCKMIMILRNGGVREVQCIFFSVENYFYCIWVKCFFCIVDWYCQSCYIYLMLSEVISNLMNDCCRDYWFIILYINDYCVVVECVFFDNFCQMFCF